MPISEKAYPFYLMQLNVAIDEGSHQCEIEVPWKLKRKDDEICSWAFPAFGIPKKVGTI